MLASIGTCGVGITIDAFDAGQKLFSADCNGTGPGLLLAFGLIVLSGLLFLIGMGALVALSVKRAFANEP